MDNQREQRIRTRDDSATPALLAVESSLGAAVVGISQASSRLGHNNPFSTTAAMITSKEDANSTTLQQSSDIDGEGILENLSDTAAGSSTEGPGDEPLFPSKLFAMLEDSESQNFSEIVSWGTDGLAFQVHKKQEFEKRILPKYFKMTKYKSFTRQLHNYGFNWIRKGQNKGGYYSSKFSRRSDPTKCHRIYRKHHAKFDRSLSAGSIDEEKISTRRRSLGGSSSSSFLLNHEIDGRMQFSRGSESILSFDAGDRLSAQMHDSQPQDTGGSLTNTTPVLLDNQRGRYLPAGYRDDGDLGGVFTSFGNMSDISSRPTLPSSSRGAVSSSTSFASIMSSNEAVSFMMDVPPEIAALGGRMMQTPDRSLLGGGYSTERTGKEQISTSSGQPGGDYQDGVLAALTTPLQQRLPSTMMMQPSNSSNSFFSSRPSIADDMILEPRTIEEMMEDPQHDNLRNQPS